MPPWLIDCALVDGIDAMHWMQGVLEQPSGLFEWDVDRRTGTLTHEKPICNNLVEAFDVAFVALERRPRIGLSRGVYATKTRAD